MTQFDPLKHLKLIEMLSKFRDIPFLLWATFYSIQNFENVLLHKSTQNDSKNSSEHLLKRFFSEIKIFISKRPKSWTKQDKLNNEMHLGRASNFFGYSLGNKIMGTTIFFVHSHYRFILYLINFIRIKSIKISSKC